MDFHDISSTRVDAGDFGPTTPEGKLMFRNAAAYEPLALNPTVKSDQFASKFSSSLTEGNTRCAIMR
jgi:hypothetical protein